MSYIKYATFSLDHIVKSNATFKFAFSIVACEGETCIDCMKRLKFWNRVIVFFA